MRFAVRSQDPVRKLVPKTTMLEKMCDIVILILKGPKSETERKARAPRPGPAEPCGGSKMILNEIDFLPSRGIVRRVLNGVNHRLASSPVSDPNSCCRVTAAA